MATTKIRNAQIKDNTIELAKLVDDFLAGANWDITAGAKNATITGLAAGVDGCDAVTVDQLNAAVGALTGVTNLRGGLPGTADLTGNTTTNAYADAGDGYMQGDFFDITADGNLVVSDGTIEVKTGDSIKILNDVATDGAITLADVHKFDNTESADIIRSGNVVDDLLSTSATNVLSANQGRILNDLITTAQGTADAAVVTAAANSVAIATNAADIAANVVLANQYETEEFAVTTDGQTFTLANAPVAGIRDRHVYLNGLRLSSGEYTISGSVLTVTVPTVEVGDCVQIDYRYA